MKGHEDARDTPRRPERRTVAASRAFPWLLHQKITIPDQVQGYVHRADLVRQAMPTQRRLTVLNASSGFGKTVLLGECCRRLRQAGVATAWISLDEQDEPAVLDTYIGFACHGAGLDLLDLSSLKETDSGPEGGIGLVVRQIQTYGEPFVIAVDELERLTNPASVALLEFLLQRGPANLHLAVACRRIPDGLNVARTVLEGRGKVVGPEALRFSKPEAARFFGLRLSRSDLTREMNRSEGWPLALRISSNRTQPGSAESGSEVRDLVENWVGSRLLADLDNDERDFLLDVGLFDWIEAGLLDEVLRRSDSRRRLESMRALAGLLEPVNGNGVEHWRLHPLVREYCAERRFRETPARFNRIHQRIARALVRRGETVPAMRHAVAGGQPALAGEILERAGGVRFWVRQGFVQLQAADRWLSEEVISTRPRLALARCAVLFLSGRLDEARKRLRDVAAAHPVREDGELPDADFEYALDHCFVRGALALYGGQVTGSDWRNLVVEFARFLASERVDPLTRAQMEYGLCVIHQLRADFAGAFEHLAKSRELLARSPFTMMHGELLQGQIAMMRGEAQVAESHYRRARSIAREHFVLDPVVLASAEIVMQEIALECNRVSSAAEPHGIARLLMRSGSPYSAIAVVGALVVERRLMEGRSDRAVAASDDFLEYTRNAGLTSLTRYFAALRISALVADGQVLEAGQAWRAEDGMPTDPKACVDLDSQSWREMEAVSLARLRCLIATGEFEQGRELAGELRAVAEEKQLRRTLMRALALSTALEQRAGESASAVRHLEEYLDLFVESPYALTLVVERELCAPAVKELLDLHPDSPRAETAHALLSAMRSVDAAEELVLSEREREVLLALDGLQDKQIAAALGLSVHGVRYHLRKLFAKLGVSSRTEAVRRAGEMRIIARDS